MVVVLVLAVVVPVSSTLGGVGVCLLLESEARPFAAWAYEKTGISGVDFLAETEEAAMNINVPFLWLVVEEGQDVV